MKIGGLQKLTLLDYPDHLACIIFTQGCNLRCPFCHNSELLDLKKDGEFSEEEIFNYLIKRRKVLDGVVITGGEPLLQPNIDLFIEQVKSLGLKVKLDTNGTSPTLLNKLIKNNLIDYIAMDIKSDWDTYKEVSGCPRINLDKIKESIKIIEEANLPYEFRTTIMKNYHNIDNITKICNYISPKSTYYLQNFVNSEFVINKKLVPFTNDELKELSKKLKEKFPNVKVRGID